MRPVSSEDLSRLDSLAGPLGGGGGGRRTILVQPQHCNGFGPNGQSSAGRDVSLRLLVLVVINPLAQQLLGRLAGPGRQ